MTRITCSPSGRPLSQTGLSRFRLRSNPKARHFDPATGQPRRRNKLEKLNQHLRRINHPLYFHHTKGWKKW